MAHGTQAEAQRPACRVGDEETRAIQEIAVRFAEGLVTNLLEGF